MASMAKLLEKTCVSFCRGSHDEHRKPRAAGARKFIIQVAQCALQGLHPLTKQPEEC